MIYMGKTNRRNHRDLDLAAMLEEDFDIESLDNNQEVNDNRKWPESRWEDRQPREY